jgi:hypothetical protein
MIIFHTEGTAAAKSPPPRTARALLAVPCHDVGQLKTAVPQLIIHAIHVIEERVAKLIQARFKVYTFRGPPPNLMSSKKDTVLALCSPSAFNETCQIVAEFMASNNRRMNSTEQSPQQQHWRSPAQTAIQQVTNKFITKFTDSRRQQLR